VKMLVRGWLLAVTLILLSVPAGAAGRHRTGPDSFLTWRAYTVEDLVKQVEGDSVIRQRLAKHFHVSQAGLASYLRKHLRVITFSESGWRPVYGVNSIGRIYRARDYFHKGAKVFGLADGTPLLKYACGNPLVTELPGQAQVAARPPQTRMHSPQEFVLVVALPVAPVIEIPTASPFTTPDERPGVADLPAAPTIAVPTAVMAASGGLALLPLVGLLGVEGGGTPPVVPEPSDLMLLAAGLAMLGGLALCRRRSELRLAAASVARRAARP